MRSGSYLQFNASAKRPATSNKASYSSSSPTPRSPPTSPPAVQPTMPAVSRNPHSLISSTSVTQYNVEPLVPDVAASRRGGRVATSRRPWRRRCQLVHPKTLMLATLFSFLLIVYWSYYLSSMAFNSDALLTRTRPDAEPVEIDLHQILHSIDLLELSKSPRTAVYIWCDDDTSFTYLNYLSLASVTRFFQPDRLLILYESRPPIITGDWVHSTADSSSPHATSDGVDQLAALMTRCKKLYQGPTKMKNATVVCRSRRSRGVVRSTDGGDVVDARQSDDSGVYFDEFVTRLLLQYGGLYVGRRTFMTEVANYFRHTGAVSEHLLMYRSKSDIGEGFVFVREPVVDPPVTGSTRPVTAAMAPSTRRPDGVPPGAEVRYYTSRELGCYEGRNFSVDALQLSVNQQVSMFACAVMVDGTPASQPRHVITMKSDFGRAARKALFNIHDDWETKYYLRAVNGSVVPPLCYF